MTAGYFKHCAGDLYYEFYQKAAPTVVLLHGATLDRRMWAAQVSDLQQDYQVLAYDLLGFGLSDDPQDMNFHHHEQLLALCDYLQIDKCHLIAFSVGGRVALNFVLHYPDRVKRMVLIDIAMEGFTYSEEAALMLQTPWRVMPSQGMAVAIEQWLALPLFFPANQDPVLKPVLQEMVNGYRGWHWRHNQVMVAPSTPVAADSLASITVPILCCVGEYDHPDFHKITQSIHKTCPNAQYVIINNAGHMCPMENPHQVNQLIQMFLLSDINQL